MGNCSIVNYEKNLLSQTNPYLRDREKRLSGLIISVCSSSAIEGIAAKTLIKKYLLKKGHHRHGHQGADAIPPISVPPRALTPPSNRHHSISTAARRLLPAHILGQSELNRTDPFPKPVDGKTPRIAASGRISLTGIHCPASSILHTNPYHKSIAKITQQ